MASCASRGLPDPQSPNELSHVMSGETAKVGVQLVERLSRLRGRGEGVGLVGKLCCPSLQEAQSGVAKVPWPLGQGALKV